MNGIENELRFRSVNKICNFYAGEAHFCTSVLNYLVEKSEKGARIILFVDSVLRDKLVDVLPKSSMDFHYENWQRNTVTYPVESILKIRNEEYFKHHLKSMMELMSQNCSEEGLIICIQKANDIQDEYLERLESLTENIASTINILRCYEFISSKQLVQKVLLNNKYILNTTGMSEINDLFHDITLKILA